MWHEQPASFFYLDHGKYFHSVIINGYVNSKIDADLNPMTTDLYILFNKQLSLLNQKEKGLILKAFIWAVRFQGDTWKNNTVTLQHSWALLEFWRLPSLYQQASVSTSENSLGWGCKCFNCCPTFHLGKWRLQERKLCDCKLPCRLDQRYPTLNSTSFIK